VRKKDKCRLERSPGYCLQPERHRSLKGRGEEEKRKGDVVWNFGKERCRKKGESDCLGMAERGEEKGRERNGKGKRKIFLWGGRYFGNVIVSCAFIQRKIVKHLYRAVNSVNSQIIRIYVQYPTTDRTQKCWTRTGDPKKPEGAGTCSAILLRQCGSGDAK